jgi:hypothetical protein
VLVLFLFGRERENLLENTADFGVHQHVSLTFIDEYRLDYPVMLQFAIKVIFADLFE